MGTLGLEARAASRLAMEQRVVGFGLAACLIALNLWDLHCQRLFFFFEEECWHYGFSGYGSRNCRREGYDESLVSSIAWRLTNGRSRHRRYGSCKLGCRNVDGIYFLQRS